MWVGFVSVRVPVLCPLVSPSCFVFLFCVPWCRRRVSCSCFVSPGVAIVFRVPVLCPLVSPSRFVFLFCVPWCRRRVSCPHGWRSGLPHFHPRPWSDFSQVSRFCPLAEISRFWHPGAALPWSGCFFFSCSFLVLDLICIPLYNII